MDDVKELAGRLERWSIYFLAQSEALKAERTSESEGLGRSGVLFKRLAEALKKGDMTVEEISADHPNFVNEEPPQVIRQQ
jgi:hypothetical protein